MSTSKVIVRYFGKEKEVTNPVLKALLHAFVVALLVSLLACSIALVVWKPLVAALVVGTVAATDFSLKRSGMAGYFRYENYFVGKTRHTNYTARFDKSAYLPPGKQDSD